MFYRPAEGHGLPENPFNAIVAPRPIGWIATRAADGSENLAPYSFFNAVAYAPPMVMFASTSAKPDRGGTKDSVANIRETGVFAVNLVDHALREAMNATSADFPREVDEFAAAGIARAPCVSIPCSRVAAAPAVLECRLWKIETLPGRANFVVFGEVTGVHLRDDCLSGGRLDARRYRPLARMGYHDYTAVSDLFEMHRPRLTAPGA
jgi:flavin reductase (DIM6/NTAB) family NADH-FMN oxidoreductase RutF